MKKLVVVLAVLGSVLLACSSAPSDPTTGTTDDEVKACPYAIPMCDLTHCKLVGGCPEQCVCDNGASTQCGPSLHCGPKQYCCDSTTAGYACLNIGYMCPL